MFSYMKGRITCENINYFIGVLNSVVKQKYSVVNLKRKDVKRKDLIQYNSWKILGEEYKMTGKYSIQKINYSTIYLILQTGCLKYKFDLTKLSKDLVNTIDFIC